MGSRKDGFLSLFFAYIGSHALLIDIDQKGVCYYSFIVLLVMSIWSLMGSFLSQLCIPSRLIRKNFGPEEFPIEIPQDVAHDMFLTKSRFGDYHRSNNLPQA